MQRDELLNRFIDALPHALYSYQEEALLAWFESDAGVMVCAPTGMGKTLLAEAAVFEALHSRQRLYYTTPLIALTDQKYRELGALAEKWGFSRQDVGLITGNRRENPDALVRVVVAEILLNHLLSPDPALLDAANLHAVVMDEFHNFNDFDRGVVWELSLVLLPRHVRVLLLSATVGNPYDFADWLAKEHGRKLVVVISTERRVPLEFCWVEDRLLTEYLPAMVAGNDADNRTPALVFCFNRDECWEVAERLKGLPLINAATRTQIETELAPFKADLSDGVGPKLQQMLIRGVGVHHAGVLPTHKHAVETLFNKKLVPFVVCTETLAAGVNLPARSVVLSTLLKGKHGDKKLIPSATAHQIFGRAGRPQFDTQGYVHVVAHEDDVKIHKWKKRYDQIDPNSKDPGIMRMRKELERKRPTRRKTEQYWSEGQLKSLIQAGPAKLFSRSMIPYSMLIFLLTKTGELRSVREFLVKRFAGAERIESFQKQLEVMVGNLAALGYLTRSEDGEHVTLADSIHKLLQFRSVDPLFGAYVAEQLAYSNFDEKVLALDSMLEMPPVIERKVRVPDLPPGPLQTQVLEPLMIQLGLTLAPLESDAQDEEDGWDDGFDEDQPRPPSMPEMLKQVFEARLPAPENVFIQPKWVTGGAIEFDGEFFKFVRSRDLVKQEGIVLRHLLRVVILAGEILTQSNDPDYARIVELATKTCRRVEPQYTERFLAEAAAVKKLEPV
ncbi:ski2-like helicase [Phycisphaerae bacterium RAS1]|nr:ski2-like helicase [Phycisphaerae bacterium RAS1]